MAKINQNVLAKQISLEEGLAIEISIAQVKEVLRITLDILATKKPSEVLQMLEERIR